MYCDPTSDDGVVAWVVVDDACYLYLVFLCGFTLGGGAV